MRPQTKACLARQAALTGVGAGRGRVAQCTTQADGRPPVLLGFARPLHVFASDSRQPAAGSRLAQPACFLALRRAHHSRLRSRERGLPPTPDHSHAGSARRAALFRPPVDPTSARHHRRRHRLPAEYEVVLAWVRETRKEPDSTALTPARLARRVRRLRYAERRCHARSITTATAYSCGSRRLCCALRMLLASPRHTGGHGRRN